ncbi:MAG: putative two-component response regulator protein [Candidatus Scalindua rubra]|uniref:Putative two-component response regulator protein n=1 Tax=Candidatus Scalindua rubra TaxID=1872076 RepID=A0A1E3X949_9BACT|nr:MAG: putative two-component response regulator protein [Candidatus Scalindua rubra]
MKTKERILIVDNNTDFCENIADVLELEGYETVEAYDGFGAIESIKENDFDLVLMDIKMPKMDGVETFRKLKEVSPETPVIMMTAFMVEDLVKLSLQEGAFGAFQKPLNLKRLFCSIEKAIPNGALIMVADDNEELCINLSDILVEKGYRVTIAKDGEIAVQMSKEKKFNIILLDMKLPEMNGLETYLAIRDIRPEVVVVIITAFKDETGNLVEQALNKNVYACMEKPLDMDRLQETMQRVLENRS